MTEAAKYLVLHDPQGFVIAKSNMDILKARADLEKRGAEIARWSHWNCKRICALRRESESEVSRKMADRVSIVAVSIAAFLTAINQISIIITAKQLWMQQQQLQQQLESRKWGDEMKRICPTCFTELPEEANNCPACGKCMREVEEYTIQYTGAAPQTKEVSIKDCAISIGDFDEKVR